MKTVAVVTVAAGLVAAQANFTNGHYECALPHQVYCLGDSLTTNIILRCDDSTLGQVGNCNDNLAGEPPMGNTYSPCWQTSNTTGDAACSKNCIVYGSSSNPNGTFTLPAEVCTPTYTATSSPATAASTSTQSVTVSTSSASDAITVGTFTTTVCTESESSTASTGAVTDPLPSSLTTSTTSVTATTNITPPTSSGSSDDGASTPPAGSTASESTSGGSGSEVTSTSTSSVAAVPTTSFPTAGAVSNHVGVGLGVMGLLVGAIL